MLNKEEEFKELCHLVKDLTGLEIRYTKSRKKEFVQIKCAIVNVMRRYYSASTLQLGRLFDMHHSSIIHHSKDHTSRYRFQSDYAALYDKLVRHAMDRSETISTDKMLHLMKNALSIKSN